MWGGGGIGGANGTRLEKRLMDYALRREVEERSRRKSTVETVNIEY